MLTIMATSFCDASLEVPPSQQAPPDSIDPVRSIDAAWSSRMACTVRHQCAGRRPRRLNLLLFFRFAEPKLHRAEPSTQRIADKFHHPTRSEPHHIFDQLEQGTPVCAAFAQHREHVRCMGVAARPREAEFEEHGQGELQYCVLTMMLSLCRRCVGG